MTEEEYNNLGYLVIDAQHVVCHDGLQWVLTTNPKIQEIEGIPLVMGDKSYYASLVPVFSVLLEDAVFSACSKDVQTFVLNNLEQYLTIEKKIFKTISSFEQRCLTLSNKLNVITCRQCGSILQANELENMLGEHECEDDAPEEVKPKRTRKKKEPKLEVEEKSLEQRVAEQLHAKKEAAIARGKARAEANKQKAN